MTFLTRRRSLLKSGPVPSQLGRSPFLRGRPRFIWGVPFLSRGGLWNGGAQARGWFLRALATVQAKRQNAAASWTAVAERSGDTALDRGLVPRISHRRQQRKPRRRSFSKSRSSCHPVQPVSMDSPTCLHRRFQPAAAAGLQPRAQARSKSGVTAPHSKTPNACVGSRSHSFQCWHSPISRREGGCQHLRPSSSKKKNRGVVDAAHEARQDLGVETVPRGRTRQSAVRCLRPALRPHGDTGYRTFDF